MAKVHKVGNFFPSVRWIFQFNKRPGKDYLAFEVSFGFYPIRAWRPFFSFNRYEIDGTPTAFQVGELRLLGFEISYKSTFRYEQSLH
jgi:hypothetical protein